MNAQGFREGVLVPREVIEAAPEVLPAIVKGARKAGLDFADMLSGLVAGQGRMGDTELAHVNPQEGAMLEAMGGAGTVNPQTGLREYYIGGGPTSGPGSSRSDYDNDRSNNAPGGGNNRSSGTETGGVSRMPFTPAPPSSGPGGPGDVSRAPLVSAGGSAGFAQAATRGPQMTVTPAQAAANYPKTAVMGGPEGAVRSVDRTVPGTTWTETDGRMYRSTGTAGLNWAGVLAPGPISPFANFVGQEMGMDPLIDLGYGKVQIDPRTGIDIVGTDRDPGGAGDRGPLRGGFPTETFASPAAGPRWTRPASMTPAARFGFETGMSPFQQRISIATRGTSGLDSYYRTGDAMDYYRNLIQRALITDSGELGNYANELRPIEGSYLDLMGVPPRTTTQGLLEALAAS